ncbi:hypothetical protein ACHAWF_013241 [Thalassiosira exigua]
MVAGPHPNHRGSGYTSFPRTSPQRSSGTGGASRDSAPSPSPSTAQYWGCSRAAAAALADDADDLFPEKAAREKGRPRRPDPPCPPDPEPETTHPPSPSAPPSSPLALVRANRKRTMEHRQQRLRNHQRWRHVHTKQPQEQPRRQDRRPDYPTEIRFAPSQELRAVSDESNNTDPPLGLEANSLSDTFGFDDKETTATLLGLEKDDADTFERIYAAEEEGTLFSSSEVELNPYTCAGFDGLYVQERRREGVVSDGSGSGDVNVNGDCCGNGGGGPRSSRNARNERNVPNDNGNEVQEASGPTRTEQSVPNHRRQARESIFRPHSDPPRPSSAPAAPASSYEQKLRAEMLSPTLAMDRRRSSSQCRSEVVPSPSPSVFTSPEGSAIQRTKSAGGGRSRDRSSSRGLGSSGRGRGRHGRSESRHRGGGRRSRSRSTSVAASKKEDAYHDSLFRGAALIREQLLRSMASADREVDEAERALAAEVAERKVRQDQARAARYRQHQQLQHRQQQQQQPQVRARQAQRNNNDDGDIDFDYSFSSGKMEGGQVDLPPPSPSRDNGARLGESQDSSALETESRRLDDLMRIFAANSSISSRTNGAGGPGEGYLLGRSGSDKENDVVDGVRYIAAHDVVSPLGSGTLSPRGHDEYASRYFQEDAPRPLAGNPESAPKPALEPKPSHLGHDHAPAGPPRHTVGSPTREPTPVIGNGRARLPMRTVVSPTREPTTSNTCNADQPVSRPVRQVAGPAPEPQRTTPGNDVDDALAHAKQAGPLWRSLVGNHVRFPSIWESLLPPTSLPVHDSRRAWSKWHHVARHRVKGDRRLNGREFGVRSRRSGGRILLRLVVRESDTRQARREIAVGCFHPNSRGIRRGEPLPEVEDVREVWMAVRWLGRAGDEDVAPELELTEDGVGHEGVVDRFLMKSRKALDYATMGSPLGRRKAVNNENVRAVSDLLRSLCRQLRSIQCPLMRFDTEPTRCPASQVFGDQPPHSFVDLHEDELAEILIANSRKKLAVLPALMLLKLFLFSKSFE